MPRSSVTASITQSQSFSFARSSSKLPVSIRVACSGVKNAAGFAFFNAVSAASARWLRSPSGVARSSSSTGTPALARCAAMREPIVPAPSTAARRSSSSGAQAGAEEEAAEAGMVMAGVLGCNLHRLRASWPLGARFITNSHASIPAAGLLWTGEEEDACAVLLV